MTFRTWVDENLRPQDINAMAEIRDFLGFDPEINQTVHPKDHMFNGQNNGYFQTSIQGLFSLVNSMKHAGMGPQAVRSVLDFGCGYGRIYRAFAAAFPKAELTALDLMEESARFCAETFGGTAIKSDENVANLSLPLRYDVIWFGSVFTHLPKARWQEFFDFLAMIAQPGGVVSFTTHGMRAIDVIQYKVDQGQSITVKLDAFNEMKETINAKGFVFMPNGPVVVKHQKSLGMEITEGLYGLSFSTRAWVTEFVESQGKWDMVGFDEAGWGNNHDVVTLRLK
jgi:2-polyprenyl-3-methyl-5-hydroxy-6-metoxy-1,4-benzoquinol methylase